MDRQVTPRPRVRLAVTLATGETVEWIGRRGERCPQHWKSLLMQLAPYGADYAGATWKRERI